MGQEELPALWENLEIMDRMGKLENLVFKVFLEDLVLWELLEIRVPLVIKVLKVLLEYLDHQETLDQQEKEDYQAVLGQEVSRECQVLLERMVLLVKMVKQVCKDHLE